MANEVYESLLAEAYKATGGQGAVFTHDDQGNVYVNQHTTEGTQKTPYSVPTWAETQSSREYRNSFMSEEAKARKASADRGEDIDTWYERATKESEAATQRYNDLSTQLSDLKEQNETSTQLKRTNILARLFGDKLGITKDNTEQISNLEKALQQADAAQKAAEEQLRHATTYKGYQKAAQNAQTIEDARERGLSYKEIADSYGQSLDALNKEQKAALESLARTRSKYDSDLSHYNAEEIQARKKQREEEEKPILEKLDDLQRQIDNITGLHTQALYRRPYDTGADAVIKQGEQLAKVAREQGTETAEANRSVKKVADYFSFTPRYSMIQDIAGIFGINLPEAYNPVSFIAELGIRAGENASKTPSDDWTQEQLNVYHVLYGDPDYGKEAAEKFAQMVNYSINSQKINTQRESYYARGEDKNGTTGSKAVKTVEGLLGAVPDMAFAAADYQNKLMDILATGQYAGHDKITTHEKFSAFSEGRASDLNRKTLSDNIPVIGGKGWGDLYQLGQSAIQSLATGHVLGEAATLGAFFVNAANSAFDEAMQRSGGNTRYATTYSLLSGAAEVIGEKVSLDHLLKGGKVGSLSFLLKQAGIEGSEEVGTSVLNQFFDIVAAKLSNEQTATQSKINALVRGGMSYEDAEKQVWKEAVNDLAWDFAGGAISGFASGGAETAIRGTRNQLWEMRKDSVLGKTNAEGQREGGKTNVSEDALRGLIDRALKRGDLRGAEELAQALQQKTGTAEEQEYGPADPRANEKMQGRLERQLNGERVNPREDAEVEGETEAKTPPALPEEFKDLNPVVAQQFARYEGRDLEMITRSMTRQEAYRYEQYLRAIGQTEKADLVERIRTDPNYHYEEQPPAYTDAEDPTRQRQQEAAGQQEAPGGQITQPQAQETAGVVKPQDSAQQQRSRDFPYTLDDILSQNQGKHSVKELVDILHNAVQQNPALVDMILDSPASNFALGNTAFGRAIKQLRAEYSDSTSGTESGTISIQTNQEVNNNAGEQTVRADEEAGAREPSAADTGAEENVQPETARDGGRNQRGPSVYQEEQRTVTKQKSDLPSFVSDEDIKNLPTSNETSELRDGELIGITTTAQKGTSKIIKPKIGSMIHYAMNLAKSLVGDKASFYENLISDEPFSSEAAGFSALGKIHIALYHDIRKAKLYDVIRTVIHEATHFRIDAAANANESLNSDSIAKEAFTNAFSSKNLAGIKLDRIANLILDSGYRDVYSARDLSRAKMLDEMFAKDQGFSQYMLSEYGAKAKEELIKKYCDKANAESLAQEILANVLSDDPEYKKLFGSGWDNLRNEISFALVKNGVLNAEDVNKIDEAVEYIRGNGYFTDNDTINEATPAKPNSPSALPVRLAASGFVNKLTDNELREVLNYALDRATPETRSQPISERLADLYLNHADELGSNSAAAWSEETGYQNNTVGKLDTKQTSSLIGTVSAVLQEMDKRGISINSLQSSVTDYENKFGMVFDENDNLVDLSQNPKADTSRKEDSDWKSEAETEADYDRRNMKRDVDALRNGTNYVKEAVPTKPEDNGWIKPVEVSEKDVKQARDAVEAKGKEAQLKDRIKALEAQKSYLEAVAAGMRETRSALYADGDLEQRKADLGYLADNTKEQLEQLDADMGYLSDELDDVLAENPGSQKAVSLVRAIENAQAQKDALNVRLDALRDEYHHLTDGDSAAMSAVRSQIDNVLSEIASLSRQLDNVSKRAERADWGSNKRTLFQAEMAENPNGLRQKQTTPEPNVYGPYKIPELNKIFRDLYEHERITVKDDSSDISEPARGMGTGYRGMQTSRNKDGSLEFRTMYDDALPTRPATDKSRKAINAPSTAYGSVAQAARSILNSKSSFFDFSKSRPKDIPSKVTNTMGQLHEHVREMMEGEHPVNALMQISNMIREFENDDDLKVFTSDSIQKAVAELNDIYYNQDITNEEKAKRMVENATKTLSLISKRVQLVDRGYHMLKSFVGPRKKRDNTDFWSKYKAMQLNPSTLFKAMDGFARDKNGSGYQIAKMIENGTALYTITQAQALQKLSAISGMEGFKEFSEGNTKPFDIDGVKITEQQAVEFIMQVRNLLATEVTGKDGPTNRLNTIEGFSIRDKDGKSTFIERSNDADGTNAEWFANLAEAFENSLSPAAKKYLEAATEILDELGQQASDIRTNLIGTGFDGSINGTYYPITYDNKNGKTNSQQSQPAGLASGPMYQSRTRNVGGYVNIKNASDTLDKYIHWASNFIGYGEVAELLRAMDNTGGRMQSLSGLADDMLGQGYSKYIEKYVNDVNEVPDGQKDNDSIWAKLRRNMASGALLGNLGVAAKQAASLWSAAGVLSPQAILSAETWFGKYSDTGNMLLQSRKIGTSLDPTISEILHNDSFMGKLMKRTRVSEFMGKATALVDYQTVKRLFAATVVDTKLSFPGLDQNSELFAQAVEAKFQDVVLQTQPIFVKNARAGYLRANDELTKAFAMFRTQPTQNLNAIVTAIGEYNALKGTEYGKAAGKKLRNTIIGQTASAVTFAVLSSLVGFARHGWKKFRDDDDELSFAQVAKRIGLDSVESLAGLTVVGGDIAKAIITMATGGEEKEFYDMNTGVLSMLGDTLSSVTTFGTNVVKAIQEDKPLAVFNAGRQAADNVLQVGLGIPANTVYRLLNTITMYSADALYALSDGKLGNRANYDDAMKMLDSYIKGNLTEEGAKTQAAKAFRKGQPENLFYELGVLDSLTSPDAKESKGRAWLREKIGSSEETDMSANRRIVNYFLNSGFNNQEIDKGIDTYAAASHYNQFYEILRNQGLTPKQSVAKLDAIDANADSKITTDELADYWKIHGHEPKENKLIEALFPVAEGGYRQIKDTKTFDTATRHYKPVVDSGVSAQKAVEIVDGCKNDSGDITQAGIYEYYLAHPDDIKQIQALYNSMGYKENGQPRTWESFLKYQAKQASKKTA